MRAILVYLDSQDFSRFAERDAQPEVAAIYDELLEMKVAGMAAFGYSYLHISEVLKPISGPYADKDRLKGRLMERLCGRNAFPYSRDLRSGRKFPNAGVWLPHEVHLEMLQRPLRQNWHAEENMELKRRGISRKERRRRLAIEACKERRILRGAAPEALPSGFIRPNVAEALRSPRAEMDHKMQTLRAFSSPAHYGDAAAVFSPVEPVWEHLGRGDRDFVNDIGGALAEVRPKFNAINAKLKELEQLLQASSQYGQKASLAVREEIRTLKKERKKLLVRGRHKAPFSHFQHFFGKCLEDDYTPRGNDFRDLLHLAYAGEVDLIRVDRTTFGRFQNYLPFQGKLVASLRELPHLIRDRFYERERENASRASGVPVP